MPSTEDNEIVPLCQSVRRSVLMYGLDDPRHFGKQQDNVNLAVRERTQMRAKSTELHLRSGRR